MNYLFTSLLAVLLCQGLMAQNHIKGKIVDELGFPVASALIVLEGSEQVVHTDFDGQFALTSDKAFYWKVKIASKGYKTESFFVLEGGDAGTITLHFDLDLNELLNETPKEESKETVGVPSDKKPIQEGMVTSSAF